jgi:hypothetical protein
MEITGLCVSQLSLTVTKHLRKINLKKERYILLHSFRGFSPLWACGKAEHHGRAHGVTNMLNSWQPGKEGGGNKVTGIKTSKFMLK